MSRCGRPASQSVSVITKTRRFQSESPRRTSHWVGSPTFGADLSQAGTVAWGSETRVRTMGVMSIRCYGEGTSMQLIAGVAERCFVSVARLGMRYGSYATRALCMNVGVFVVVLVRKQALRNIVDKCAVALYGIVSLFIFRCNETDLQSVPVSLGFWRNFRLLEQNKSLWKIYSIHERKRIKKAQRNKTKLTPQSNYFRNLHENQDTPDHRFEYLHASISTISRP